MLSAPVTDWGAALMSSTAAAFAILLSGIPKAVGFLVILIVGWLVASALAASVTALLRAVRFNDLARRSGLAGFVFTTTAGRLHHPTYETVQRWVPRGRIELPTLRFSVVCSTY